MTPENFRPDGIDLLDRVDPGFITNVRIAPENVEPTHPVGWLADFRIKSLKEGSSIYVSTRSIALMTLV